MKILIFGLMIILSASLYAQGRPGSAGGATSGANPAPQDRMVEEFKKLAKTCNNLEFTGDLYQIYEFFRARELTEMVSGHNHEECKNLAPDGEHVTITLGCYLTDNFKAATRAFLKDKHALDEIRKTFKAGEKLRSGLTKKVKMTKEEAQAVWDYLNQLVSDKK